MRDNGEAPSQMTADPLIQVVLVDDHALVTDLLRHWLSRDAAIHVAGVAGTIRALKTLAARRADVVLMDYVLPDGTGIDGIRVAKRRWPAARVLMLTGWDDDAVMLEAIQAGADGYLLKDRPPEEVLQAVRVAYGGGVLVPPEVVGRLAAEVAARRAAGEPTSAPLPALTRREEQVLHQLVAGASTAEVSRRLGMTPSTVRTHVRNILRKLGVHSKLAAVALALSQGLVHPTPGRSAPSPK